MIKIGERGDGPIRELIGLAIVVIVNASWMVGMLIGLAFGRDTLVAPGWLMLVHGSALFVYLMFGRGRGRATALELALPIPARRLWLRRVVRIVIGGTIVIAGTTIVMLVEAVAVSRSIFAIDPMVLAGLMFAILIVAVAVLEGFDPHLGELPRSWRHHVRNAAVLVGVGVLGGWLGLASPWWMLAPALLALVYMVYVYRSVPPAFVLVGRKPVEATASIERPMTSGFSDETSRWGWRATFARLTSHGHYDWLIASFTVMFGVLLAGGFGPELERIRFMYVPLVIYQLYAFTAKRMNTLVHIDSLPVSRRTIFALFVCPYLLLIMVGYGGGALIGNAINGQAETVSAVEREWGLEIRVPHAHYEIKAVDDPLVVDTPWGESQTLKSYPFYRGSAYGLQCFYNAPNGSSMAFAALQISRAAEAVYGVAIDPAEIAQRYLETGEDGRPALQEHGLTLRRDDPDLRPGWNGPTFPVVMAFVIVSWLILFALMLRTYRGSASERTRQIVFWVPAVLLMVFFFGMFALIISNYVESWSIQALGNLLVEAAGAHPIGRILTWGAALALVVGAYMFARSRFMRIEVPARAACFKLWDWGPGAPAQRSN